MQIHVGDINDNLPQLASKGVVMCGNKENKVMMQAKDGDKPPFSGPFSFSLGGDDKTLEDKWKLDPAYGQSPVTKFIHKPVRRFSWLSHYRLLFSLFPR